jgi:hypothetical protein
MSVHTKEPWRVGKLSHPRDYEKVRETAGLLDIVVDTETVPYVLASCNLNFPEDAKANARRIVACVNACAGISTENLEQNKPIKEGLHGLNDRIRTAEKQRDELLYVLEDVLDRYALEIGYTNWREVEGQIFDDSRALIKRIKEI